ncbi:PREDICTED: uncharacterized protein LOC101293225 [Fragaria vesca subsp. vesca]|uniref:uncharacterized protein LOC101293225 n=1 Tax=Fragaria vesca subsp. vesca TaxID=101020 RepID=UPI0002C3480D|nr:PREDICTED: uncharacterized protein LOC101293225 [Fragaria vesca subsp. vesca]XP_011459174.1 PREDICTED: uncharacterized protein LOC101293225 [Fragaria vesca subsp. vesca]
MNSQSNGRSLRPKGKRVKLAFQIGSVLAVCLWLLYQAKQSHDTDYSGSVRNEVIIERGSGILGRRVNAGGSSLVGESVNDEVRGGGVDVSDGNVEEKHKASDDTDHGDLGRHEGKESEKRVGLKYKELSNADDIPDINSEENSLQEGNSQVGHQDKQASRMSDQEGEKDVENTSHHKVGGDEDAMSHVNHDEQGHESDAQKESDTKDFSSENEFLVPPTERKNDSLQDHNSMVDGVHGFDDETGVPEDGNDIIESRVTESSGDREISLHEDMYTTSSRQSEINESTQSEEVVARGDNANFEARSNISVQDSEPEAETNSETSVHIDTSRINSTNVTKQGGTSVSDL